MELRFKHTILDLSTPKIMGILNITPDSFYDGGSYLSNESILAQAQKLLMDGADIIDIGAVSTRPNASIVNENDELMRLIPAIELLKEKFPDCIISVDTYRSNVATKAIEAGADMVNDISGGTFDTNMFDVVAKLNVPFVLMHIQGTPQDMQHNPSYVDVSNDVNDFFSRQITVAKKKGIEQIILDPGFGFGKTLEHNYTLLKELSAFKLFNYPILAGLSRKSMLGKVISLPPVDSLNATTAANTIALMNGATILRVHDAKEANQAIQIFTFASK